MSSKSINEHFVYSNIVSHVIPSLISRGGFGSPPPSHPQNLEPLTGRVKILEILEISGILEISEILEIAEILEIFEFLEISEISVILEISEILDISVILDIS